MLSPVRLFVTQWTAACQASLSFTISWSLFKLTFIKSVMPSNHLILLSPSPSAFNLLQQTLPVPTPQIAHTHVSFRLPPVSPVTLWSLGQLMSEPSCDQHFDPLHFMLPHCSYLLTFPQSQEETPALSHAMHII